MWPKPCSSSRLVKISASTLQRSTFIGSSSSYKTPHIIYPQLLSGVFFVSPCAWCFWTLFVSRTLFFLHLPSFVCWRDTLGLKLAWRDKTVSLKKNYWTCFCLHLDKIIIEILFKLLLFQCATHTEWALLSARWRCLLTKLSLRISALHQAGHLGAETDLRFWFWSDWSLFCLN